jgi:hypothetical protein
LVIPILIACSSVEQSIGYATAGATISISAEETKTVANDENIKSSDVKMKDCNDNKNKNNKDDNSNVCLDSKSKDSVTSKSSDDTTAETLQNNNDDNKKHKDPFLLPFP